MGRRQPLLHTLLLLLLFIFTSCKSLISINSELENLHIVNQSKGDLNGDGISDIAVVVSNELSEKDAVIVFLLNSKRNITQKFVNKHLAYSFIDWFGELPETTIENGQLSVWYYGGMCHRQSRTIVFDFDKKQTDLFFKELVVAEHNVCNDQTSFSEKTSSPELQKVMFTNYKDEL